MKIFNWDDINLKELENMIVCGNCAKCHFVHSGSNKAFYCDDWLYDPIWDYNEFIYTNRGKDICNRFTKKNDKILKKDLQKWINIVKKKFENNKGYYLDVELNEIIECIKYDFNYIYPTTIDKNKDIGKVTILNYSFEIVADVDIWNKNSMFHKNKNDINITINNEIKNKHNEIKNKHNEINNLNLLKGDIK